MPQQLLPVFVIAVLCLLSPFLLFGIFALGAAAASGDYARHEATKVAAAEKWAKRIGEK